MAKNTTHYRQQNEASFHPLFIGALAGNKAIYTELLSHISSLARHYVERKIGQHDASEDIVQEILISVHKALHTYDPSRPCMPWLASIMHYRLSDWMRSHYRTSAHKTVSLDDVEDFLSADVTIPSIENECIKKAVSALSPKQQQVIEAMYFKEMTVSEASEALAMSVSAVKVTAHRAYKQLALLLGEER